MRNAIRSLLDVVAAGHELSKQDLAELKFGDRVNRSEVERRVRSAARAIASCVEDGNRGEARRLAQIHAAQISEYAGDPLPTREELPTDPAELAAKVHF